MSGVDKGTRCEQLSVVDRLRDSVNTVAVVSAASALVDDEYEI